ncbi:unnamed protein product [Linum trigynum]|uniref:GPI inositol-deacylase n=1 Tax=Linum trigynum TaxID=586398 RepID=A0AAV2CKJ7_9ROSI
MAMAFSLRVRVTPTSKPPPASSSSSSSSSSSIPRTAVILPGLGNNSADYASLQLTLQGEYGVPTVVAKVSRVDWLRNAAGLLDPSYWSGTLKPRPVLDWYLKRVDDAVQEAKALAQGDETLSLIGHSAGGWLARVYMEEFGVSDISLLLTLGTPHLPPPKGIPGVIDQTRGLLYYVEEHCRKAVFTPQLKYVCVAGRYIKGTKLVGNTEEQQVGPVVPVTDEVLAADVVNSTTNPTFRARFVGQGYKQVCGRADVWGDGVVPEESAHLEGALNITLDGVYHSPIGSSDDSQRPWYGSPGVIEQWVHHLLH